MKKIFLIFLLIPILGVTSCVKQKNCEGCDNEKVGWIQYTKEPVTNTFYGYSDSDRKKITAILYPNLDYKLGFPIAGNIPKEYRSGDFIRVRVCLTTTEKGLILLDNHIPICKLTCIEKED